MKNIKVSIVCISYNQERYIAQAIDSFISQQTDFNIEIIIADDASTDTTQAIIERYAKKYPDIIIPVLRKKNVGIQKNLYDALDRAKGEFIAICEGDDYWTDSDKIQLQASLMDQKENVSVCFHPVRVVYEKSEEPDSIFPELSKDLPFTLETLLRVNFIQTNSVMYRRQTYKELKRSVMPADWYLHLFHAQFGEIAIIDRVMSVYRRHEEGVWWKTVDDRDEVWKKHGLGHMALFMELLEFYGHTDTYRDIIIENVVVTLRTFNRIDANDGTTLFKDCFERFSEKGDYLLEATFNLINEDRKIQLSQKEHIQHLEKISHDRLDEIADIKGSKYFGIVKKVTEVKSKLKF